MYQKVITMTAYKRPEYTKKVLDNLQQCIGFEEYTLLPTIEPGFPEVIELFSDISNCNVEVNNERLGCCTNTLKALRRGFEISDFVIHIEDDTIPGIDSLLYFEWANNTYRDDREIFSITAYNRLRDINNIKSQDYFTSYRQKWFTGWMWGTWLDRFEEMSKRWNFCSWDINLNKKVRGKRYEICPSLPRSQNIGEYSGTNVRPSFWRKYHYSEFWINNILNFSDISPYIESFRSRNLHLIYKEVKEPIYNLYLQEEIQLETEKLMLIGILTGSTYLLFT